jgi:hypothetical protein
MTADVNINVTWRGGGALTAQPFWLQKILLFVSKMQPGKSRNVVLGLN